MLGSHIGLGDVVVVTPAVSAPMSTGTKIVIGLGVVSAAALGLWYVQRHEAVANPALPTSAQPEQFSRGSRKTSPRQTARRPLAFRVRLDVSPAYEAVVLFPNGTAILYRYRYPVVRFRPAKYQYRKISRGEGELFIYADQILESLVGR